MLSERGIFYYNKGYNCAQCILKACEDEYNINISNDCINSAGGLYNGLGVGSCCGVLIASIMVIGILCDNVPFYRLEMAERFNCEFGSLSCYKLKKDNNCCKLIEVSCNILADIIDKGQKKY